MESKINRLREKLEASINRYQLLYETSPDMYVSVNTDGSIKDCNQTLVEKSGYRKEDIIGKSIFMLYHPDSLERAQDAFQSFLQQGKVVNANLELRRANGSKIPVLLNVEAIKDEKGAILYSNSCWRDVSKIQRLEEELKEKNKELAEKVCQLEAKNKELEQFAYVTSHDLQEPLTTIMGLTQLFEKEYCDQLDDEASKYLRFISQASSRMRELVIALLEYSQLGNKREFHLIDCNEIVKNMLDDLSAIIASTNTTFEIGALPQVKGNATELRLLFQNLISNAIKFRHKRKRPHIKISSLLEDGYWKISIQDNGIGIAPDHQQKIFVIFRRLHAASDYEGTGIGLAHCQKIVEVHKGKIWVESQEGYGSTFHISLPQLIDEG